MSMKKGIGSEKKADNLKVKTLKVNNTRKRL